MTGQHMTSEQLYLDIYDCIMDMRLETAYKKLTPDPEKMKKIIRWCHENGFLYYDGKCLMLGKTFTPWYNNDVHASDILLYTRKEHRGKGLAAKAIDEFLKWAKDKGASDIKLSQSTGITASEFQALADKFNLKKVGEVYCV